MASSLRSRCAIRIQNVRALIVCIHLYSWCKLHCASERFAQSYIKLSTEMLRDTRTLIIFENYFHARRLMAHTHCKSLRARVCYLTSLYASAFSIIKNTHRQQRECALCFIITSRRVKSIYLPIGDSAAGGGATHDFTHPKGGCVLQKIKQFTFL